MNYTPIFSISFVGQLKVMTYALQAAAEDEPSQEKGIVVILMMSKLHTGKATSKNPNRRFDSFLRVLHSSPIRVGGFHVCSPDLPEFHTAKTELVNSLNRNIRLRTRLHHGKSNDLHGLSYDRTILAHTQTKFSPQVFFFIGIKTTRHDDGMHFRNQSLWSPYRSIATQVRR